MGREDIKPSLISPLIPDSVEERSHEKWFKREEVVEEVKKQLWLAGPLICVNILQYSIQIIAVMFVGHLGELSLSGAMAL